MKRIPSRKHYVYALFRPNGIICYIGKGKGDRWLKHEKCAKRKIGNQHLSHIINKAGGVLPKIKIRERLTEAEAFEIEEAFIQVIGREEDGGLLVNKAFGGKGGCAGIKRTKQQRLARSITARKQWQDPSYREIQRQAKLGNNNSKKPHTISDEWREELTNKMKGNSYTLGLQLPKSFGDQVAKRWQDPKYRERIMASRKASGQYSPENCRKRWEKRKANMDKVS